MAKKIFVKLYTDGKKTLVRLYTDGKKIFTRLYTDGIYGPIGDKKALVYQMVAKRPTPDSVLVKDKNLCICTMKRSTKAV